MYRDRSDCPIPKEPKCLKPVACKYKLAHAYVPYQSLDKIFCPEEALKKGTLFPELYMPYKRKKGCRR
ncbi:spore coat associated protein JA [Gottschalkia purinilytica]|uniref:Spore coat associated protein JA n=1 Tax=Gottschalkia purinilytica TaxID=1503 RepID=A0A0L0WB68_GOTPU|nr:spore coat associated protein CotJA [Gottschalkia purinilytica]KNF08575.1 spore coat associated protein JA [Gottschalkia purinilytica]